MIRPVEATVLAALMVPLVTTMIGLTLDADVPLFVPPCFVIDYMPGND